VWTARAQAAVFAAFLLLGLARAAPSLSWPMVYDDLHLVRPYTGAEIAGAWHGSWDPDGIETPGFRPGSLLFNHVRALMLGENVAAHRVLLIILYAFYVALLVPLAARFGAGPGTVLLAGVVMLAARYGVYHYVWITDGNHMVQGLAFAGGALLLLGGLDRRDPVRLGLSLVCLAGGLLVREDTMAAVPVVLLLGFLHARRHGRPMLQALGVHAAILILLCAMLFAWRGLVVPQAAAPGADVRSFAVAVARALNPVGLESFSPASRLLSIAGWVVLSGFVAALARFRSQVDWRGPTLWLAAAIIACAPALSFRRDDLLFFAGTFVGLFYATAAVELARTGGAARLLAVAGLAVIVAGGLHTGLVFAENFHPDSTRSLSWNTEMVHGEYAGRTTIPAIRRQAVVERLARVGIRGGEQPRQRVRALAAAARAAGRRRPAPDGEVFVPLLPEGF
jgi:hypothetical protein